MTKFLVAAVFGLCAYQAWDYFKAKPDVRGRAVSETAAVATIGTIPVAAPAAGAKAEVVAQKPVTLYATSWCGYCRAARQFFEANGVAYKEFDIEKSEEGAKQYRALGGTGGVPLITVGETKLRGFSEGKLRDVLGLKS